MKRSEDIKSLFLGHIGGSRPSALRPALYDREREEKSNWSFFSLSVPQWGLPFLPYVEATAFCRISNPIFCRNVSTLHNGERLLGPFVLSKPGLQSRVARVHGVAVFLGGVTIHKGFNKFVRYYIRNGCLGKGIPLSPPPWKGMEGRWCETGE